jgi:uncharacterized protein Smg (DUF494 family)
MEELGVLDGEEIEVLIQKSLALGKQKIEVQTLKNLANVLLFSDNNIREQSADFLWTDQERI